MHQYILRRILYLFPVLLGVSFLVFFLIRLIPGDVVMLMLTETPNVKNVQELRAKLGLDKPVHEQYLIWVSGVVRGNLGESIWSGKPVLAEILKRLPVSAELAIMAFLVSLVIGVSMGVISAVKQDTVFDYAARVFNIAGLSVPNFWLGTLLVVLPAIWLNWSPPIGFVPLFKNPWANLQQVLLPSLVLGYGLSASVGRMTRSCMLEVLRQDYIRTAWAKGLVERAIIVRHALKNAMMPVVTIIGLQFGYLMAGTVIIEVVFTLPGFGRLTVDSIFQRDYAQLQGNILFIAVLYVLVNLVVDVVYVWLDPRLRYN